MQQATAMKVKSCKEMGGVTYVCDACQQGRVQSASGWYHSVYAVIGCSMQVVSFNFYRISVLSVQKGQKYKCNAEVIDGDAANTQTFLCSTLWICTQHFSKLLTYSVLRPTQPPTLHRCHYDSRKLSFTNRVIYVAAKACFKAKSAFWRGFSALAPYTGVGPI